MKNLYEKKLDVNAQSKFAGNGNYHTSGGTESTPTSGGSDTFTTTFNDDCGVSSQTMSYC